MDENLVGYLLNALDPVEHRETEAYLRAHPEGHRRLDLLRRALAPLALEGQDPLPAPGLWLRTLARVAEYRCRDLPRAPVTAAVRSAAPSRPWWRRADVLVAAGLLLVVSSLLIPWLHDLQHRRQVAECQQKLEVLYVALQDYSDRHRGEFPRVDKDPPWNFAGVFLPILRQAGSLRPDVNVHCPSGGRLPPEEVTLQQLEVLHASAPDRFEQHAARAAGCFAYPLGYRDEAGLHRGLHRDRLQARRADLPILGDRPPFEMQARSDLGRNSPNHNDRGQNVLYLDGHVQFCKGRNVGVDLDDIYLNKLRRVEAGMSVWDIVLGASAFRPYPNLPAD
jgi:prepilin-type processing-associated H-X9-DG protein